MREIKFRGKRIDNDEWVYGYLWESQDPTKTEKSIKATFIYTACSVERGYEVFPESVGQYTGLKDKNDKEIYEGDILKLDGWKGTQQICFIKGAFCLADKEGAFVGDIHYIHHASIKQSKIVGNIYENPELLNKD